MDLRRKTPYKLDRADTAKAFEMLEQMKKDPNLLFHRGKSGVWYFNATRAQHPKTQTYARFPRFLEQEGLLFSTREKNSNILEVLTLSDKALVLTKEEVTTETTFLSALERLKEFSEEEIEDILSFGLNALAEQTEAELRKRHATLDKIAGALECLPTS
jgi:protease II